MTSSIGGNFNQFLTDVRAGTDVNHAARHRGVDLTRLTHDEQEDLGVAQGRLKRTEENRLHNGREATVKHVTEKQGNWDKALNIFKSAVTPIDNVKNAINLAATGLRAAGSSPTQRTEQINKAQKNLGLKVTTQTVKSSDLTAAKCRELWGFNAKNKGEVVEQVREARASGRRIKARDGSPHEYIVLNNSAIILIPNGKDEDAYVRTLYDTGTGKGFMGDDLKRAINCLLELHDPIVEAGGEAYNTWCLDLVVKQVRGFAHHPSDDIIGNTDAGDVIRIDSSHFDKCDAQYDFEKSQEAKTDINNKDIPRRQKEDEGSPVKKKKEGTTTPAPTPTPPRTYGSGMSGFKGPRIQVPGSHGGSPPTTPRGPAAPILGSSATATATPAAGHAGDATAL